MALSKPTNAVQQLLFKITSAGSLRGTMTPDKGFQMSVLYFIEKACAYKKGSSSARSEWARIRACARDPSAKFHHEAATIVAGRRETLRNRDAPSEIVAFLQRLG